MKYEPMLAETGKISLLENNNYLFEPKLDGTRCVLVKRGRRVYMFNRLGQDFSYLYPLIKRAFEKYSDNFILDSEIICYNERGLPDHRLLMRRDQAMSKNEIDMRAHAIPATLVAFDVIILNNKELMSQKIEERKKKLKQLIKEGRHAERIMFTEEGSKLWDLVKKSKMEGVMAKKKGSYYLPGERSKDWLKIKNNKSVDAVIMGYTPEKGPGKTFDSLIIGLYKGKELVKVGTVKTGWDAESKKYIIKKLSPLKTKMKEKVQYVKPKEVCEVDYLELTKEKELRSPVYKRLRHKPVKKCTWKQLK
ncbi:hypothetical protein GF352_01420 [archaeon]|nr:hypothetical protein [archaeon]